MDIRKVSKPILIGAAVVILAIIVVLGQFFSKAATIDITVNGTPLTIHGAKTMQTAIQESGLPINPGDLISLRGTVLKKSEGYPFSATINGEETVNPDHSLQNGDVITVADGEDRIEDYDSYEEPIPHGAIVAGSGALSTFEVGEDGVTEVRTGRLSGDVVRRVKREETDTLLVYYNPDVGDDKVLALTFDEGPSKEFTSSILDVLKENDARATFFCEGTEVERNQDLVKRELEEGHMVCTNTYDRAWEPVEAAVNPNADGDSSDSDDSTDPSDSGDSGDTGNSNDTTSSADSADSKQLVNADDLVNEVERGRQVISDALDGQEASRIVRIPTTILSDPMALALETHIDGEVRWNVDTGDWAGNNAEGMYHILMDTEPGDVVLLHDGGDDCSATIEALGKALPRLKKLGYSFVTIDELMEYPSL